MKNKKRINFFGMVRRVKALEIRINELDVFAKIQRSLAKHDPYSNGFANGLIFSVALMQGKSPKYVILDKKNGEVYEVVSERLKKFDINKKS